MHRIGIISDTHGLLRPEVLEHLRGCEVILHGGDINQQKILDELNQIAPVYAVRGNNDKEWAADMPQTLSLELYGLHFFMVHNKKELPRDTAGIDILIYGHSHKYEENYVGRQLFLNPGSCGPRRFTQPITMAVLEIEEDTSFRVKRIEIPHQALRAEMKQDTGGASGLHNIDDCGTQDSPDSMKIPANIKQIILCVIRDTDRGKSVKEIAGKYGISKDLAEQICRLYLTHPGVTADGIMTKMGL